MNENCLANHRDGNTRCATGKNIDIVIDALLSDINTLIDWFKVNYFLLNSDQCNLSITNHDKDVSIKLYKDIIMGKKMGGNF